MNYAIISLPKEKLFLAKSAKGLLAAHFVKNTRDIEEPLEFFSRKGFNPVRDESKFTKEKELFERYFSGKREDFTSLSLDLSLGTPYQQKVWLEARKIPYGKTEAYKSLARNLNHKGYRSIGQALSKNPLLVIIPCHRVLRSDGSLGGFSAGLDLKEFLLGLEKGKMRA